MNFTDLLVDSFGRIREAVESVLEGISAEQLVFQPDAGANTIAWLVWHLTRAQDDHLAGAAGSEQVWTSQGFFERFALPFDPSEHGYGHDIEHVKAVQAPAHLLLAYHEAVHRRTVELVQELDEADLERIVDERFEPPVTLGVRLVSVISDDLQHAGQAAYLRGIAERR